MISNFFRRVQSGFEAVARNPNNPNAEPIVVESDDELGYFLKRKRFFGATKDTKKALLAIMPESEWETMRENAWDDYIREGSYYRKDAV